MPTNKVTESDRTLDILSKNKANGLCLFNFFNVILDLILDDKGKNIGEEYKELHIFMRKQFKALD